MPRPGGSGRGALNRAEPHKHNKALKSQTNVTPGPPRLHSGLVQVVVTCAQEVFVPRPSESALDINHGEPRRNTTRKGAGGRRAREQPGRTCGARSASQSACPRTAVEAPPSPASHRPTRSRPPAPPPHGTQHTGARKPTVPRKTPIGFLVPPCSFAMHGGIMSGPTDTPCCQDQKTTLLIEGAFRVRRR